MSTAALPQKHRDLAPLGPYVGMVVFLACWGMAFASLFFAYAVVRMQARAWPPAGSEHLPIALPALNTALLALSSWTFHRAHAALRSQKPWIGLLGVTLTLGGAFLVLQVMVWRSVWASGLTTATEGNYGAVFYALTVFHGLHVAAALIWGLALIPGALRGRYTRSHDNPVRLGAMFWHFVDAVWLFMFVTVYVL